MNAGKWTERFVFPHFDRFKQFFQALLEGLNNRHRRQSSYFCIVEHTEKNGQIGKAKKRKGTHFGLRPLSDKSGTDDPTHRGQEMQRNGEAD